MRRFVTLKGKENFKALKVASRKLYSENFIMCARFSTSGAFCLGIITSKKLGSSVKRNRIRRRVKAAFHNILAGFNLPIDVLVIPRAFVLDAPFSMIEQELKNLIINFYEKQ